MQPNSYNMRMKSVLHCMNVDKSHVHCNITEEDKRGNDVVVHDFGVLESAYISQNVGARVTIDPSETSFYARKLKIFCESDGKKLTCDKNWR